MIIFPAKRDIEKSILEERVKELSGSNIPDLVWVDNLAENYRFWGIYPLFAPGGVLTRDVILPLDAYGMILPKGCKIEKSRGKKSSGENGTAYGRDNMADGKNGTAYGKDSTAYGKDSMADGKNGTAYGKDSTTDGKDDGEIGWVISGEISFRYTGAAVRVEKAEIGRDGVLRFSFPGNLLGFPFGTGIRYALSSYDERVERTIFKTLYSEVFALEEAARLEVNFFPAAIPENRWELEEQAEVQTVLQTVYLQKVRLSLPKGFRFVLAAGVDENGYEEAYFTPSGSAKIEGGGFLMPGLTGTERIEMGTELGFCPGGRAYFDDAEMQGKPDTAYLSFASSVYYCQPEHMNFYTQGNPEKHARQADGLHMAGNPQEYFEKHARQADGLYPAGYPQGNPEMQGGLCTARSGSAEDGIYEYASLPGVPLGAAGLPIFPFGGLRENSREAVKLEEIYLSGMRKSMVEGQIAEHALCGEEITYAVTKSGMKAAYNSEKLLWMQTAPLQELTPGIAFTSMHSRFWFALLSSKLFLALTDLEGMASVPYSVTARRLQLAKEAGYRDGEKLAPLCGQTFFTAEELKAAAAGKQAGWESSLREACCHFNQNLAGWEFRCSPDRWKEYKTLAVLKMVDDRSMDECMEEVWLWGWKPKKEEEEKAKRYYVETAALLPDPGLQKLTEILTEKEWKGTVFFRAGVDVSGMPKELAFLAKGIDTEKFLAAYVAFPAVGMSSDGQSPGSALIAYEDSQALHLEEYQEFGWKVRRLLLDIRENKIYRFQASVELLINALFGYQTVGRADEESCSLVFNGSYQENESNGYYAFVLEKPVEYILENCGIKRIRMESASLETEGENGRFVLGGSFLLAAEEHADLLSFEKLPFDGLAVEMKTAESGYDFRVDYESMVLRPQDGVLREASFGALFPAKVSRLVMQENRKATELGFETLKIKGYGDEEALGENWTGFLWLIETGNLGGLAAAVNLTLELLTAFGPDPESPAGQPHFYCGLRIQSLVKTDTFALPLQGIMSLGFDSMELKKDGDFYFRFRNFSLTILGKRFPETNNDLYLIADDHGNLGWYGAVEG